MNYLAEKHEELLTQWSNLSHHKNKGFIKDGIIDPDRWNVAPRKILLFLKEAYNDPDNPEDDDLRAVIREDWKGAKYKLWWTAAYWCYAIHHGDFKSIPPFPSDEKSFELASESLLSSAFINVKKSSGKSQSENDDIEFYAKKDGDLISKQIGLINPDIVICGNVWWCSSYLWPESKQIYDLVWRNGDTYFIDYWHPAYQISNQLNYYALGSLLLFSGFLN